MVKIIMHGCNGHMGQVISDIVEKDAHLRNAGFNVCLRRGNSL